MHRVLLSFVDDEQFARKGLRNLIDWEQYGYKVVNEWTMEKMHSR